MEDLYQEVDPEDADLLRCPSCGDIGSASAMEERQLRAKANLQKYLETGDSSDDILKDVLWCIRDDKRKNLGKSGGSRSKSNKEDKLKSTRLRKCLDDDSVASASRPKALSPKDVMLTIRKMGHVPSKTLRKAMLAYLVHLVEIGRLPPDFFNPGGKNDHQS